MNREMVVEFTKKRWQNLFVWYTCQLVESTQKRDFGTTIYNTETPEFSSCTRPNFLGTFLRWITGSFINVTHFAADLGNAGRPSILFPDSGLGGWAPASFQTTGPKIPAR
jgi:hypothetical protein